MGRAAKRKRLLKQLKKLTNPSKSFASSSNFIHQLEEKDYLVEIPPRFKDNFEQDLQSFSDFASKTIDSVMTSLEQKYSLGFKSPKVRDIFFIQMRAEFEKYFKSYSPEEQEYLIIGFVGKDWNEFLNLMLQDDVKDVVKSIEQNLDNIFQVWLDYQIFKPFVGTPPKINLIGGIKTRFAEPL